ncbi:MAG: O-antigen ligase family protein, partial [Planctomycetota bacterium]
TLGVGAILVGSFIVLSTQPGLGQKLNQRLINLVSKSGTTEELTSGTGRSEIWGASVRLIAQRPLTGYGAATSKDLLAEYTRYTHNMMLNVGLSGGILPMALLAAAFFYGCRKLWSDPQLVPDAIFLFLFLNGLAENVCFLVLDSAPMILLTTALVWRNVCSAANIKQVPAALLAKGATL